MIKAVIFDIDNTLTEDVSWLRVTELCGASPAVHQGIFDRFRAGELSYIDSKRQLIQLWHETGNARKVFWNEMFAAWPLKDDAKPLIAFLQETGYEIALITGSMDLFASAIAKKLGIQHWYANTELVWNSEGNLVDFHYVRDQAAQKLLHLKDFVRQQGIALDNCVVVGDGDNDKELFRATKRGVAVGDSADLRDLAWKSVVNLAEIEDLAAEF